MSRLLFAGRTIIVTGAGGGLGKAYALEFARRGGNILVNDLGGSLAGEGKNKSAAGLVVEEIVKNGGKAVANYDNVATEGDKIVEHALKHFGGVDVVVNNAGILRDKSFHKMTKEDWNSVLNVHLNGTFAVSFAAWPFMMEKKYGRIVNVGSGLLMLAAL